MPPTPTMMAAMAEGALHTSLRSDGTLHVDLNHLEASKSWIGQVTSNLISQLTPPGTQSYVPKHVANRTPNATMLATHHGHSPSNNPTMVEICQVLKLKIAQMINDTLSNIKLQLTQQPAASTTTATMAMTMTMTLPPTMNPNYLFDPVNLTMIWSKIDRELPQLPTTKEDTINNATSKATSTMAISLMMLMMMPLTPPEAIEHITQQLLAMTDTWLIVAIPALPTNNPPLTHCHHLRCQPPTPAFPSNPLSPTHVDPTGPPCSRFKPTQQPTTAGNCWIPQPTTCCHHWITSPATTSLFLPVPLQNYFSKLASPTSFLTVLHCMAKSNYWPPSNTPFQCELKCESFIPPCGI